MITTRAVTAFSGEKNPGISSARRFAANPSRRAVRPFQGDNRNLLRKFFLGPAKDGAYDTRDFIYALSRNGSCEAQEGPAKDHIGQGDNVFA
jgi:hypothetical protein